MALIAMKPRFTQKQRRNDLFRRVLPLVSCITLCRVMDNHSARGNFAHAHIVITKRLIILDLHTNAGGF